MPSTAASSLKSQKSIAKRKSYTREFKLKVAAFYRENNLYRFVDVMTTGNTGEDENSIATFGTCNNARARHFHVQEVGGSFLQ